MNSTHFALFLGALALATTSCTDERTSIPAAEERPDASKAPTQQSDKRSSESDGPAASEEPPPRDGWCSKQGAHTLCSDFDGPDVTEGWSIAGDPSQFTAVASDRSSPNALQVVESLDAPEAAMMSLVQKVAPKRVHLEADVRVGAPNDGRTRTPIVIQLITKKGTVPEVVQLSLRSGETTLLVFAHDGSTPPDQDDFSVRKTPPLPEGWVRIAIDLERTDALLLASIAFDGVPGGEVSIPATKAALEAVNINLGSIGSERAAQPFVIAFDNVVVDVE